jgi:hypothetical protein
VRCSCGHTFAPSAETFTGTQLFTDHDTGAVYLYLLLYGCPRCASTRCIVFFDTTDEADEDERAQAAE